MLDGSGFVDEPGHLSNRKMYAGFNPYDYKKKYMPNSSRLEIEDRDTFLTTGRPELAVALEHFWNLEVDDGSREVEWKMEEAEWKGVLAALAKEWKIPLFATAIEEMIISWILPPKDRLMAFIEYWHKPRSGDYFEPRIVYVRVYSKLVLGERVDASTWKKGNKYCHLELYYAYRVISIAQYANDGYPQRQELDEAMPGGLRQLAGNHPLLLRTSVDTHSRQALQTDKNILLITR